MAGKLLSLLSIAGSDNMGGAGIQADIRVGTSLGYHVLTAVTCITAQNSDALLDSVAISPTLLEKQLKAILKDVTPDAIKIGMIGSVENLHVISRFIAELPSGIPIVVDPVLYVTVEEPSLLRFELKSLELRKGYLSEIFPKATVITPNLHELKLLTGEIKSGPDTLASLNAKAAVIKGGHSGKEVIEDILIMSPNREIHNSHPKLKCANLHGTGCVFSSLLACYLGMGDNLETAFYKTTRRLYINIEKSCNYSLGNSNYGPININENYFVL